MPNKKILIADDIPETREMLRMAMELSGYDVIEAEDGHEALLKAINEKPDLIIMDISMPRSDGYTASLELNKNPLTQRIPIIISSGHGKMQNVFFKKATDGQARGQSTDSEAAIIADFIEKPFLPDELVSKVKKILGE